jgi:hypothetical protein
MATAPAPYRTVRRDSSPLHVGRINQGVVQVTAYGRQSEERRPEEGVRTYPCTTKKFLRRPTAKGLVLSQKLGRQPPKNTTI